jgi:hypothetical protein
VAAVQRRSPFDVVAGAGRAPTAITARRRRVRPAPCINGLAASKLDLFNVLSTLRKRQACLLVFVHGSTYRRIMGRGQSSERSRRGRDFKRPAFGGEIRAGGGAVSHYNKKV